MKKQIEKPPKQLKVIPQRVQTTNLDIPHLEYKVVAQPVLKTTFTGHVTVVPTVLIFYLHSQEFKIVAAIIQETMETGTCILTAKQFSIRLEMSMPTIYNALFNLRKMHILFEKREGIFTHRAINFEAVQYLNDITSMEDRGIYTRLRAKCKLKNITKISQKDFDGCYDQYVLPVDHDIEEEEEYD